MKELKDLNLILDLDDTLIHGFKCNFGQYVVDRPHLKEFLHFAFTHFKTVSIWTAATSTWFNYCYYYGIKQHMPPNKTFTFIATRETSCLPLTNGFIKFLPDLYKLNPFFHSENTILIDDRQQNFLRNPHNTIQIKPFDAHMVIHKQEDNELLRIIDYLTKHYFVSSC